MKTRSRVVLFAVLLGMAAWLPAQEEQSLGDVARQNRAEKKPKAVITDDSMAVGDTQGQATGTTGEPAKPQAASSAASGDDANDPESNPMTAGADDPNRVHGNVAGKGWKTETGKDRIETLKEERAALSGKLDKLREKLANEKDEFRRNMWQEAIERQTGTLQQMSQEQNDLEKAEAEKEKEQAEAAAQNGGSAETTPAPPPQPVEK